MSVSMKVFTHRCAACEREFTHPSSREDLLSSYRKKHPAVNINSLHIFCESCYDHVQKFPQVPIGNFVFTCPGCGMSHLAPSGCHDVYPVLFLPFKITPERVCESCYEKALGALN